MRCRVGASSPRRRSLPAFPRVVLLTCSLLVLPSHGAAQGVRGWVNSTVQMVELRPFGQDTVAPDGVVRGADGQFLLDGVPVSCVVTQYCTRYVTLPKQQLVAATQDVSFTAWGFGLQGLSFTAHLRGRAHGGSDLLWPRSDDAFDAILGYGQWLGGPLRVRLGRQEVVSGLGFPAFDGASVSYARGPTLLEAYGGRSLARGLREPANVALRGIEDYLVDEGARLFGAALRRRLDGAVLTARYHREILSDGSGLVGERASLDFATALPDVRVTGSVDYDFGFSRWGKSHLTLGMPLNGGRVLVEATARRYVPYFQMSTIWGFFEPVSYSEVELRGSWAHGSDLGVWASGGRRHYGDTHTQVLMGPLTDKGWRANAGARWQALSAVVVDGSYRLEWGPGAFLSSGDVAVRLDTGEGATFTLSGTSFQQVEEFRVGDGRALGGGLSFDMVLTRRTTLAGGLSVLRHRDGGTVFTSPWNQTRGWTSLRIGIGGDPGLANTRKPR